LLQQGVDLWFSENSTYTYGTTDTTHLHYTQVVWANTRTLGCGATFCPMVGSLPNATLVVCNYAPPGNFIGQAPYASGAACTQCPSDLATWGSGLCAAAVASVPALPSPALYLLSLLLFAAAAALARWRLVGSSRARL
jgi:hypothetical protein